MDDYRGVPILLDANILLAQGNPNAQNAIEVEEKLIQLLNSEAELLVSPQTLYEYYVVATRPKAVNGLGLATSVAQQELDTLCRFFKLLPDPPNLFSTWRQLIRDHSISGKPAHDARQAAWLLAHDLQHIYTLNVRDFARFAPTVQCVD